MLPFKSNAVAISLCALLIGGCSGSKTNESTGQYIDNSVITTKVKTKLFEKLGTDGFAIKVKSYKRDVQLSGFVNSEKIKQNAARIAKSVTGVDTVSNDLIVK